MKLEDRHFPLSIEHQKRLVELLDKLEKMMDRGHHVILRLSKSLERKMEEIDDLKMLVQTLEEQNQQLIEKVLEHDNRNNDLS